jgi:class 3 adenylate cyclase/tetratricopeptide (TPR) repeat protein
MADEIAAWLEGLGLEKYAEAFHAQDIDLRSLPYLTEADLQALGVSLGHRRIMLAAIANLAAPPPIAPAAPPPPSQQATEQAERRLVSVLFCDMVGSTELSRRLDPEDLRQLLRDYQDRVAGAIARYGGHLAQYMGDGVMAFFGWPTAYEDQAERAVRAGLEAIEAIKAIEAGSVEAGSVDPIRSRIAIATGEVVVGDLSSSGRQEGGIAGKTPNFAARLQQCAGADQLVIDDATRLLVGGAFEVSDHGSHTLKGFDGATQVFRVDGIRDVESRFDATRGQSLSRFVGRTNELALVLEKWAHAKGGEGQVVLIAGEAGIGKSRLVRAVADAAGEEPHVYRQIQCSPYHTSSALFPVIQALTRRLGLNQDDSAGQRLDKLMALLQDTTPEVGAGVRAAVPVFAELLSLELTDEFERPAISPQEMKALTLSSLVDRVATTAETSPLLLVVEDAHWIDPTTFELIEQTVARIAAARVLMLITHRPEWHADWAGQYGHVTALTLGRLARPQIAELVRDVMGLTAADELIGEIALRTDGVPMFVEEVARSLVEAGAQQSADTARVPTTLQGALMARLDGLLAPTREIVQAASVMGREFHPDVVGIVCRSTRAAIDTALDELIGARLVTRGGAGADTFAFRHALIQDVAYQSLLRNKRQYLHHAVADALAEIRPDVTETQPELLAHHLTEAGLQARALDMWRRAGERALARFANDEAVRHFEKGLEVAGHLPTIEDRGREVLASELLLGKAQRIAGELPEAMATFGKAADLARSRGDSAALIEAALGFDNAEFSVSGPNYESKTLLREALSLIGEAPDSYERCQVMGRLTRAYIMSGEPVAAAECGQKTAAMARRLGDDDTLAEVLIQGFLVPKPGYEPTQFASIAAQLDELVETAERLDNFDLYGRAMSLCFYRWTELGERERMDAILARLSDYAEHRQYPLLRWIARHCQALRSVIDGDLTAAETFTEEGLELGRRCQGDQAEGVYGIQMFTIRREQGRLAEVAPFVKRLIDGAPAGSVWRPGFALIASDLGYRAPAERLLGEFAADEFAVPRDAKRSTTLVYLAEVCAALGDGNRAEALYELLKPYSNMTITAGVNAVCYGSAQRYLGLLADTMGSREPAEEHFENALAFNERLKAPLWVAHTQCDYGRMLQGRGTPADLKRADSLLEAAWSTASRLGLGALTGKLRHLQM